MKNAVVCFLLCLCAVVLSGEVQANEAPKKDAHRIDLSDWQLVWQDDFDYADEELDENWESQNGPSGHILCSRWRENAVVADGILQLINLKEQRGEQEWTSGNIWTRRRFTYGYFECRYRYAGATGTNNSFWLMTRGADPAQGKRFEIDINEGHYPNEVNTNIHNHSDVTVRADGRRAHPSHSKSFSFGLDPAYSLPLDGAIITRRMRLVSLHPAHFHIREMRFYHKYRVKYPNPLSETADQDVAGLVNYARDAHTVVTTSGQYNSTTLAQHAVDGTLGTSWISQREGEKWIEFAWPEEKRIGCIQFVNGWQRQGRWQGLISDYTLQYHDGQDWVDIDAFNAQDNPATNFSQTFHTYGLQWDEHEIVFYFDGQEIRREANEFCHSEVPIWLSLAVIPWAGPVTDAIDGTSMKVDWVRYYQKKK